MTRPRCDQGAVILEPLIAGVVVVLAVTLRQYALVTSTAAFFVALYAIWLSRKAVRTVQDEVLPQLRSMTGDDDREEP